MKVQLRWTALKVAMLFLTFVPAASAQRCWQETKAEAKSDLHGIPSAIGSIPSGVVHHDYKWLLPVAATAGLLIGTDADEHASNHITSTSLQHTSSVLSNVGLYGIALGTAAGTYAIACRGAESTGERSKSFRVLEAMGYATAADEILKLGFNRMRPDVPGSEASFWEGGKSFPSGHAAASWAFASAMAHQHPHNKWVKIGSYSLAVTVSGLRFSAKKHYLSDIVVGGAVGYPIGRHFGEQ